MMASVGSSATSSPCLCYCGAPSKLRVARTEKNNGRRFFACNVYDKSKRKGVCDFFSWADVGQNVDHQTGTENAKIAEELLLERKLRTEYMEKYFLLKMKFMYCIFAIVLLLLWVCYTTNECNQQLY